jgi:hypothetical protein
MNREAHEERRVFEVLLRCFVAFVVPDVANRGMNREAHEGAKTVKENERGCETIARTAHTARFEVLSFSHVAS